MSTIADTSKIDVKGIIASITQRDERNVWFSFESPTTPFQKAKFANLIIVKDEN